jgi:diadenosine tetraphosphatase ApaH/serine/threonine PP2A family protein phosphatase
VRVAVLSDIHANWEVLCAVVDHARSLDAEKFVSLGDVVGYGANPNECIALLRSLPLSAALLGNHDAAVLGLHAKMHRDAREVIDWTRRTLTPESLRFLQQMEDLVRWGDIAFCHSNPYRPREWYYIAERHYISKSFARSKAKILFVGHTHVPIAITRRNFFCVYIYTPLHNMTIPAAEKNRQIFNSGSVGQPRDNDRRASYLIYDDCRRSIEFYRVSYAYERAAEKIIEAGLPVGFANRLAEGV